MRIKFTLAALLGIGLTATTHLAWADEVAPAVQAQEAGFAPMPLTLSEPLKLNAAPGGPAVNAGAPYRGGRGLITLQGMSGMFINPTSGTLGQGQLTIQYCLLVEKFNLNSRVGHGLMASYGVTDWLELGMFGTVAEVNGVDRRIVNNAIGVGGPFVRVRLLKEDGAIPELSVGGMYANGGNQGDVLARTEGFIAASKHIPLDIDGTFKSLRGHAGFRYVSRREANSAAVPNGVLGHGDFALAYGGLELELPYSFYLVGEISTNNLLKRAGHDLPFAAGIQWKPNAVLGISLAYSNPEFLGLVRGLWFGIGLNFKF